MMLPSDIFNGHVANDPAFFSVAARGFSLPRGLGAACLDARRCARFHLPLLSGSKNV